METLDAPIYEVKQDSEWFKSKKKEREDINKFFESFKEKYGFTEGFGFYTSEYFGAHGDTKAYEFFKDDLVKNSTKDGFYSFKKRSKSFKEIKELLEKVEQISPFQPHDIFGLNNVKASQWIGDRWFFEVKNTKHIKSDEVKPIDFKEYLSLVMETLD